MKRLKIKVCGMREPENIAGVGALEPDFMGFIFYAGSKRYAPDLRTADLRLVPAATTPVGVFVNEEETVLRETCERLHILTVQLHGEESPDYCARMREAGLKVIKAFGLRTLADLTPVRDFPDVADLFLFDARVPGYGGGGVSFDWTMLSNYEGALPFVLSGGIGPDDAEAILQLDHPDLYGIDLNSRFEISPGLKDVEGLERFIKKIRDL